MIGHNIQATCFLLQQATCYRSNHIVRHSPTSHEIHSHKESGVSHVPQLASSYANPNSECDYAIYSQRKRPEKHVNAMVTTSGNLGFESDQGMHRCRPEFSGPPAHFRGHMPLAMCKCCGSLLFGRETLPDRAAHAKP